ncbi:tetratricopeptide repeat protein [Minwuia sp.]|uniref:tetratricopeptide repeat protein n=1 Tax=Minwuia sp. TaxID=2493630 RepID=UPI003A901181
MNIGIKSAFGTTFAIAMGVLVAMGTASAQDNEPSKRWKDALERAKLGSAVAQCELGELVVRGQEAERGMKVAAKWFKQAADQDALCGLLRMAEFHRRGTGVKKDVGISDTYYERALPLVLALARQGDVEMQIQLAKMHHKALGTKEDLELAGFWYKTAASLLEPLVKAGDLDAAKKLGNILVIGVGVDRDPIRAAQLYERAAEAGDRAGQYLAGLMFFTGRAGHPVDHERGFKWLYLAADADHPRSQYFVGTAYADGLGIEADATRAAKWLTLAGDRGVNASTPAMKALIEKAPRDDVEKGIDLAENWVPVFERENTTPSS